MHLRFTVSPIFVLLAGLIVPAMGQAPSTQTVAGFPGAPAPHGGPISVSPDADPANPYVTRPTEVHFLPGETSLACLPGDLIHFTGPFDVAKADRCFLEIDRKRIGAAQDAGALQTAGRFDFAWTAAEPGLHRARLAFAMPNGRTAYGEHWTVRVLSAPPLTFQDAPHSGIADVHLSGANAGADFVVSHVDFYLNGEKVSSSAGPSYSVTIPLSKLPGGACALAYEATDTQGCPYISRADFFLIPERVTYTGPLQVTLLKDDEKVALRAGVIAGLTPKKIIYTVDDKPVAEAAAAPFSAQANLSDLASGDHQVRARVVTADNQEFDSPAVAVTVRNRPEEARAVSRDKEEKDRQAAVEIAQARAAEAAANAEAAQAQAAAAEVERQRQYKRAHQKIPAGVLARACADAINTYHDANPNAQMTDGKFILTEITDIRRSDSEVFPYDVYAIVDGPSVTAMHEIYQVNPSTHEVSNYVRRW